MTTIGELNQLGRRLEEALLLETAPLAVKMLATEADIPEGAFRPKHDQGIHLAQCQAFAMSRREGKTVAMLTEDHWCFAPLIAYGHVDVPEDPELARFVRFPRFERGRWAGIVSAPLRSAGFVPDVIMLYSNTAQLRNLLWPSEIMGEAVEVVSNFYPPSCGYSVVPVVDERRVVVTLPDPGDYARALAGEDEIIIAMPPDLLAGLLDDLEAVRGMGAAFEPQVMEPDFKRPDFYVRLFERWGLDT
jgi:uncharacterized protein (DUF169 family)